MATDEQYFVTQVHLVNLTGVRDEGVQALILLATSLGWNVMTKRGQPAILTSRDGTQKRIPTDTSIRMSVFQTALSTIMVHSGNYEPTLELVDDIIKMTKPSKDHQRRLRLAVGETPQEHRERVANADRPAADVPKGEHLTQRVKLPEIEPEVPVYLINDDLTQGPPADGQNHGTLVSREPYRAHYSGNSESGAYFYQSEVSLERTWGDGYKDYECTVCGKALGSPRGVGGHRQIHTKRGEVEAIGVTPWRRPDAVKGRDKAWEVTPRAEPTVEFVDELPSTEVHLEEQEQQLAEAEVAIDIQREYMGKTIEPTADDIVAAIIKLVLPKVMADADAVILALTEERDAALKMAADMEGEFEALVDLLNSRKRK